jgi:hypothetical protein
VKAKSGYMIIINTSPDLCQQKETTHVLVNNLFKNAARSAALQFPSLALVRN